MSRLKATTDFYVDELICPEVYKVLGATRSLTLISPKLINVVQGVRTLISSPITINNWYNGGRFEYSGLRPYNCPIGAKASYHKTGEAADLKFSTITPEIALELIEKHIDIFWALGLRAVENIAYTKTWLHVSVQETNMNELKVFNP